jgi:hypothetical protein
MEYWVFKPPAPQHSNPPLLLTDIFCFEISLYTPWASEYNTGVSEIPKAAKACFCLPWVSEQLEWSAKTCTFEFAARCPPRRARASRLPRAKAI